MAESGMTLDDVMNLDGLASGGQEFLKQKSEEAERENYAFEVLKRYFGGSEKAALTALRSEDGLKDVEKGTKKVIEAAIEGWYENREDILGKLPDKKYVSRMDLGFFVELAEGEDDLSKTYRNYVDARSNLKRVQDGDESIGKEITERETKALEEEIKKNYEKSEDPVVKRMSKEEREEAIQLATKAYRAELKSGGYRSFVIEEFERTRKAYEDAFGGDKGKADFARQAIANLAAKDDKSKFIAYSIFKDIQKEEKK